MENPNSPQSHIDAMLAQDAYTKWMGLEIIDLKKGYCKLTYRLKPEMLNGFGMAHGGALFSASDSAFAFASNSHGNLSVGLNVSITYFAPGKSGELLTVEAVEEHLGRKTATYRVTTFNSAEDVLCVFNGTVYRTGKPVKP